MLTPEIHAKIAASTLFRNVELEGIQFRLQDCRVVTVCRGEALLVPGRPNEHLFIILGGELRVYPGGPQLPEHAVLQAGECVGEISLIDGKNVSATVIAAEPTEVLAIPHDLVWSLVDMADGLARNLLSILAGRMRHDNLALVINQSQSLEFERASSVDIVTALHNRRWLIETFPRVIRRCERDGASLCLVLMDPDRFGELNQRRGHLVGDSLLRLIAGELMESLRAQDLLARYDGRAIAILLPQADTETGLRIADRLRRIVSETRLQVSEDGGAESITVSCGVAPLRLGDTLDTLIAAAEAALRRAKDNGRNRVEVAG